MSYRPDDPAEGSGGFGIPIGVGAFAKEVEIVRIENQCNFPGRYSFSFTNSDYKPELSLLIHYREDSGYEGSFMTWGKYFRDRTSGAIKGWTKYSSTLRFLSYLDPEKKIEYANDDHSLNEDVLEKYYGKKCYVIKYQSNETYTADDGEEKYSMKTWDVIFRAGTDIDVMKGYWRDNSKYCKKYSSATWLKLQEEWEAKKNDEQNGFNYGANAPEEENKPTEDDII